MKMRLCTKACAAADNLQRSGGTAISRLIFVVEFPLCLRVTWDPCVLSGHKQLFVQRSRCAHWEMVAT